MDATITYIYCTKNFAISFTNWNMVEEKVQDLITMYTKNGLNMGIKISIFKSNLE